jgi:hypothetical protein
MVLQVPTCLPVRNHVWNKSAAPCSCNHRNRRFQKVIHFSGLADNGGRRRIASFKGGIYG